MMGTGIKVMVNRQILMGLESIQEIKSIGIGYELDLRKKRNEGCFLGT